VSILQGVVQLLTDYVAAALLGLAVPGKHLALTGSGRDLHSIVLPRGTVVAAVFCVAPAEQAVEFVGVLKIFWK
jgi:hypothetical protein